MSQRPDFRRFTFEREREREMKSWWERRRRFSNRWRSVAMSGEVAGLRRELSDLRRAHNSCLTRLREADHRAKNSLQLASAMLRLEARVTPADCHDPLTTAADRLWALAQLHKAISESGAGPLRVCDCLRPIAHAYQGVQGAEVTLSSNDLECAAAQATPLALIVNEALMNALKHHGPGAAHVAVEVRDSSGRLEVAVQDDGDGFTDQAGDGFGLKMMQTLARQIGGELQVSSGPAHGARVAVTIPRNNTIQG